MTVLLIGGTGALGAGLQDSWSSIEFDKVYTADKFGDPDFFVDAMDENSLSQLFGNIYNSEIQLSCVVNLVGKIENKPFYSVFEKPKIHDSSSWNRVISHNLFTAFLITRAYFEFCQRRKIKMNLIHFSSISAQGNPGQVAYSVAKAGVETLVKTLAKELGPLGHRINCVAPGYIDVESTHANMTIPSLEKIIRTTPLRKLGDVESIAAILLALMTSKFLNGQIIGVDGGLTI
ncbi:SDR family oxidoreductase [Planktomarina temperata]|nr:SDR family oxidoreductase [Planktomarina temperata]